MVIPPFLELDRGQPINGPLNSQPNTAYSTLG
jgi:hypothetical protein